MSTHHYADFNSAKSMVHSAFHQWNLPPRSRDAGPNRRIFITISRQCGTNGAEFAHALAERLNHDAPEEGAGGAPWTAWDHELIDHVCTAEGLSPRIVAQIEDHPHTWVQELMDAFATSHAAEHAAEYRVYKRIVATIHALAAAGHAILVGQGGRWATQKLPGGLHIRLVAPIDFRIRCTAQFHDLTPREATLRVEEIDHNRDRFFARYWPGKSLDAESFAMTLNTAELAVEDLVDCVAPLIHARETAVAMD